MHYSRVETTTLSSIRSRFLNGQIDTVKVAFHNIQEKNESDSSMFAEIDDPAKDIPNAPQTVKARVDYGFSENAAYIRAETLYGYDSSFDVHLDRIT